MSQGGEDTPFTPESISLPFQFSRLAATGQIGAVRVHPDEPLDLENVKKSIAESFQTNLAVIDGDRAETEFEAVVEEAGASGVRLVSYSLLKNAGGEAVVLGEYGRRDFVSFAAGGAAGARAPFGLHATKTSRVNVADGAVLASSATTEIVARHARNHRAGSAASLKITSVTEMAFVSGDLAMIEVLEEADWQVESLVHEVDPASRLENLKASLPSIQSLVASLRDASLPLKEVLKVRGYLVTLMNADQASLATGLAALAADLQAAKGSQLPLLYSTLAMVNAAEAQQLLAAQLTAATGAGDAERAVAVLKGLAALSRPADTSVLLASVQAALSGAAASSRVRALGDLTVGHLAKLLPVEAAAEVLLPYAKLLETAETEADKIQLLHVLGNAGRNSPVPLVASFIHDASLQVRAAALSNLRTAMHLSEVQDAVVSMMDQRANRQTRSIISSLVTAVKHTVKENDLGDDFRQYLTDLAASEPLASEAMASLAEYLAKPEAAEAPRRPHFRPHHHQNREPEPQPLASTSSVWNDTSDANFNLVAPAAQRQQDVNTYPAYNAFLFSQQIGPRFTNLKIVGGAFSGSGDDACLAGDFKIFDKLYSETHVFGNTTIIADLQLYILTYENTFESRVYAIVNGNTLIDFSISSNCSSEELAIYEGVISILDYTTEIPIDLGNVLVYGYVYAGLTLDAGYELCLLTLNPFVELWITGQVDLVVDAGATVTAVGIIRGGLEGDLYANYIVGPDTQLGSIVNSTTGEHVCKACIGVYYGYEDQTGYLGLFIQRREGLGWGDKVTITLAEFVEPGVPFPAPLAEACTEDVTPAPTDFQVIKRHNAN